MTDNKQDLAHLRARIAQLDEQLLDVLKKRMECSKEIGTIKSKSGLPVKDYLVEKQVIDKTKNQAIQAGLNAEFIEVCMRAIIEESVALQLDLQQRSQGVHTQSKKGVLVIGGAGNMGRWLCQFFAAFGHEVAIHDPEAPKERQLTHAHVELEAGLKDAEIIVVATPLKATAEVLEKILAYRPKGLIVEIASLKANLEPTLKKAHQQGFRVMSLHPMFGPSAVSLSGRNMLVCTAPFLDAGTEMTNMFAATSANIYHLPFTEHDRLMSYVLGAAHLSNLVFGEVLTRAEQPIRNLLRGAGTTFLNQLRVTQTVVDENKDLYYEIQTLNPETGELLSQFEQALAVYKTAITGHKRDSFRDLMGKSQKLVSPNSR